MKSTTSLAIIATITLTACAAASGEDDLMASPTSTPPMHSTGLDAAVDAAGRKTEGNGESPPVRRSTDLPDAGALDASPRVDAAVEVVDASRDVPPPTPTWHPLGRTARQAVTGCCGSSSTGAFDCNAATVGTELRLGADAERKSSLTERAEYGWLQGTSVSFNGATAVITGRSSCGCDNVVTLLSEAYVCAY